MKKIKFHIFQKKEKEKSGQMVRFFDGIVPVQRPTKGSKGRETSFAGRRRAYVRVQPPTNWGPPRQVQVR